MNTRVPFCKLLTLLLFSGLAVCGALAANSASPCEKTADRMLTACDLDAREEFQITMANCTNILSRTDRRVCRADAQDAKEETREECEDQHEARLDVCDLLHEQRYDPDPLLDPTIAFIDPDDVPGIYDPNPYVSVAAGHTYVLRAGEDGEETVIVNVTDESREISGVLCRVVVDAVVLTEEDEEQGGIDYVPVEITDDWFAQDEIGDVYYCGEISRNYEEGVLTDIDGSFESGREFAKAGVLIRAFPVAGEAHRQEFSLEEAEDVVEYVSLSGAPTAEMGGENETFPCAPAGCLQTHDSAALEPEDTEFKFYREDVGFVLAVALEDGEVTGEREELVCVGDSLEILFDESCGIEDPVELLEELCELAPDAFCADDGD